MPQKFLSVKNFEVYQNYKKKSPPWFKVYKSMYGDKEFQKLSVSSRYLYTGLIMLATECGNRIYNDCTWIGKRLDIQCTQNDLRPLYRAGFLSCSNIRRVLSETETETETETEEREREKIPAPPKVVEIKIGKRALRDDDGPTDKHRAFAMHLKIDIGPEWGKFKNYCLAHDKRYANFEAAFRNWLAKAADFKEHRRVL